jgi:UDP-2,3-diacylglucosamine pyrophosphatase LpxH
MPRTVLVISDLHLGGAPDFQMCSPAGRTLLAEFLTWTARRAAVGEDIHLVVNGDLVDFLAERPFMALTVNNTEATRKLGEIVKNSAPVWDGFRAVAQSGAEITILLGNHDLELTLPGPNALLRTTLGPGRLSLLLDGEALDLGDVLIEHGNRCDSWNLVDHKALRAIRSDISRRVDPLPAFPAPPGSKLVVEVMNVVKKQFRFVDLLKPETDAVLPILAALASVSAAQIKIVAAYYLEASREKFDAEQRPVNRDKISSGPPAASQPMPPGAQLALEFLAQNPQPDRSKVSAGGSLDFFKLWRSQSKERRDEMLGQLYDALRYRMAAHDAAFRIDKELPEYLTAANASENRGFKTVIYGHTHLAKRAPLAKGGTYLNTGTWADLMRLPLAVVQGNRLAALGELEAFLAALEANRLDEWRRPRPTFAEIVMEDLDQIRADVFSYSGGDRAVPLVDEAFR